jgi:hypothetical protein
VVFREPSSPLLPETSFALQDFRLFIKIKEQGTDGKQQDVSVSKRVGKWLTVRRVEQFVAGHVHDAKKCDHDQDRNISRK